MKLAPPQPPRRRPGLTAMVDVVFLLLVFFMLAARFGTDTSLPLALAAGGDDAWQGPPRLIELTVQGTVLNGQPLPPEALAGALIALMPRPDAPVLLRAAPGVTLDRLTLLLDDLRAAGITSAVLVE
ncbi:MAG: biopolymer transporter ExbD [Rhodobacteraceae bacterium]|nr:biopolymer transporter ExbD [Paracoccaceae bacterium]